MPRQLIDVAAAVRLRASGLRWAQVAAILSRGRRMPFTEKAVAAAVRRSRRT